MKYPSVSIIIVNYNVKEFLIQCIDSINQTDYLGKTEIIIIDNGSEEKNVLDYYKSLPFKILIYSFPVAA